MNISIDKNVEIHRSKRKTLSLEIKGDKRLIIRAPMRMPIRDIQRFINEKSDWIEKTFEKIDMANANRRDTESLSEEEIAKLTKLAKYCIPAKVSLYSRAVGVSYGRITIRHQKTRWGSCSSIGNLNFNCLLMLTPEYVQDYVVVHELCHRLHMDHSRAFWSEVERVLPDYREARKWLKENGGSIIDSME